jgi:hypothetical protein
MKFAFALVAVATLALAPAANAAGLTECVTLAKQVTAALESAQPGTSTDAARQQASVGRTYCGSQMYAQGVAHYSKALQLLGKN